MSYWSSFFTALTMMTEKTFSSENYKIAIETAVEWQFDIRISICTTDISFIVHHYYRLVIIAEDSDSAAVC